MKHDLKRIESTLEHLQAQSQPVSLPTPGPSLAPSPSPNGRSVSFRVEPNSAESPCAESETARSSLRDLFPEATLEDAAPFPSLPLVNSPTFTTHRSTANPTLALNLLREMEGVVNGWQIALQTLMQQIQALYQEGPIVDGWLESYTHEEAAMLNLRHADVECLLDYVEKRWSSEAIAGPQSAPASSSDKSDATAGYRLCGLTEDGQSWFRHCPSEQVPIVSLAIARYQRLRQLLAQKQTIETRLSRLAETLIEVRSQFQP